MTEVQGLLQIRARFASKVCGFACCRMAGGRGWIRPVYPPERQQAIAEYLIERPDRRAGIAQIGARLGVTSETVRKDLDVLERRGVLRRVRGGAELLSTTPFE